MVQAAVPYDELARRYLDDASDSSSVELKCIASLSYTCAPPPGDHDVRPAALQRAVQKTVRPFDRPGYELAHGSDDDGEDVFEEQFWRNEMRGASLHTCFCFRYEHAAGTA
jgi:hypothetical protein